MFRFYARILNAYLVGKVQWYGSIRCGARRILEHIYYFVKGRKKPGWVYPLFTQEQERAKKIRNGLHLRSHCSLVYNHYGGLTNPTTLRALNKPIEYFFGESFESEEIENLVFIIRKQPKEQQKKIIEQTRMLLSLDAFQQMAIGKEREMSDQEINEAVNYVIRYADEIEAIYKVTSELQSNIKDALKPQQ